VNRSFEVRFGEGCQGIARAVASRSVIYSTGGGSLSTNGPLG